MFKNIIIATDGSDHAIRAVDVAADIASTYRARLIIVNVIVASLTLSELEKLPQSQRFSQEVRDQIEGAWVPFGKTEIYSDAIPMPIQVPYAVLDALSKG